MTKTYNLLVVGSSGCVGTAIVDRLQDRDQYTVTCIDSIEHPDHETITSDMRDYEAIRPYFENQDVVVHAALNPDLNSSVTDIAWNHALMDNLWGTCTIMRAAVDAGVETLVYTSSHHVVGMYEKEHAPELYNVDYDLVVDHTTTPCPDSMYAVEKVFDEALGRFCADWHDLSVFAIRIATVRDRETDNPYGPAERSVELGYTERGSESYEQGVKRMKATWFSRRDLAHMVDCCVKNGGTGFEILYGVSDNDRRWFDIERAKDIVGYDPQDNGEEWNTPPS